MLEQWAYLAEIGGMIAVVVTLAFLAVQIRQSTVQMRLDSMAKAIETQVYQFAHLTDDIHKAQLLRRAFADFENLNQDEKGLVHAIFLEINISHNIIKHAFDAHLLDDIALGLFDTCDRPIVTETRGQYD
jgi:hypothetical protein